MIKIIYTIIFLLTYYYYNIKYATATTASIFFIVIVNSKIKKNILNYKYIFIFILCLVSLFLSIIFDNDIFIKLKPTFIYWCIVIFFISSFNNKIFLLIEIKKNLIYIKNYIKYSFSIFFFLMGLLNLYIIINFDTYIWIIFKFVISLLMIIIFIVIQYIILYKHISFRF
jgi:intracellular septation protein